MAETVKPMSAVIGVGQTANDVGNATAVYLYNNTGGPVTIHRYTMQTCRYLRWTINQQKDVPSATDDVQAAGFTLMKDAVAVSYPGGSSANNPGGNSSTSANNLLDGNPATKWLDHNFADNNSIIIIDTTAAMVTFNGYRYTTADDAPERDPTGWVLETSNNAFDWAVYDSRTNETITATRQTDTQTFSGANGFVGSVIVPNSAFMILEKEQGDLINVTSNTIAATRVGATN